MRKSNSSGKFFIAWFQAEGCIIKVMVMSNYSHIFFAHVLRFTGHNIRNAAGQIRKSIFTFPIILCCFLSVSYITAEAQSGGFERGLAYYNKGQYDEALNEFKAAVNRNSHNPLSYYYAAHIRLKKKQYTRSEKNLLAALKDSSDFSDATGLLAFTHLRMGKPMRQWKTGALLLKRLEY